MTSIRMRDSMYPYYLSLNGKVSILLWVPTEKGDRFKTLKDGSLFTGQSKQEVVRKLRKESKLIKWNESAEIDINALWKKLNSLRVGRTSSEATCRFLLDAWNFLEDLLKTVALVEILAKSKSAVLKKAYNKIFFGNNLASVTPAGSLYNPLWSKDEIVAIKGYLHLAWSAISERFSEA